MLKINSYKLETVKRSLKRLAMAVLFGVMLLPVCSYTREGARVEAATSSTLNFQARLLNASGSLVADGYYNIQFKLYDVSTSGTALWTETYYDSNGATAGSDNRVRVKNGYFSVNLGSLTSFGTNINWDQDLWLTMNIGGSAQTASPTYDGEMSPRIKLTGVPYAFRAAQLAKQTGSNTSTLDFATQTGARSILLPDESGTLCIQSSSNCGFATGAGAAFLQGGNAFGATGTLGTTDSNDLNILTANTTRLTVQADGDIAFDTDTLFVDAANNRVGIGTAAPGFALDVVGIANVSDTLIVGDTLSAYSILPQTIHAGETFGSSADCSLGCYGIQAMPFIDNPTSPNAAFGLVAMVSTSNTAFTLSSATGIQVFTPTKGAASTITNAQGIAVAAQTAGTNNAGIVIDEATGTNQANLVIGQTTIPSGTYSIYNSSSDQNYFAGSLGIGTSTVGAKLQVNAAASGIGQIIKANATTPGDLLQLQSSSGAVLSGITSAGKLYYNNSTFTGLLDIATLTSNQTYTLPNATGTFCLTSGNCAGVGGTGDILNNGQNGPITIGTNDATTLSFETSNTSRLTINSSGNLGLGISSTAGALLSVGGTVGNFQVNSSGAITAVTDIAASGGYTQSGSSVNSFSGQVGIGIPNPNAPLHVVGSSGTGLVLASVSTAAGANTGVEFRYGSGDTTTTERISRILATTQAGGGGDLALQTATTSNGTYTTRLYVQADGNVGIGDSSPAALLTVGSGDLFQVNSSGAIAAVTGITTTGGYTQTGTSANTFSGNLGIGVAADGTIPLKVACAGSTCTQMRLERTGDATVDFEIDEAANLDDDFKLTVAGSAGTAKYYFTDEGRVGFNTDPSNIPGAQLEVVGSASVDYFSLSSTITANGDILKVTSGGNVGIGINTPTSARLQVQGSAGQQAVLADSSITDSGSVMVIQGTLSRASSNSTYGSGLLLNNTLAPTSGQSNLSFIDISGTINQTGTATGVTRGLYVRPTVTAASDLRGVEVANNSGYGIYQSGASAQNYFAGKLGIGDSSPAALLTVGSGDLFQVNSSGVVSYVDGTANSATYVCKNSSGQLAACNTTGTGVAFLQGGNSFGATAVLGTSDNNNLELKTNNTTRLTVDTSGNATLTGDFTVQGGDITGNGGLTLTGGTGASNNLTLQSTSNSTRGSVLINDTMSILNANRTFTSSPTLVDLGGGSSRTHTVDAAFGSFFGLSFTPTVQFQQSGNPFAMGALFNAAGTFKNVSGVSATLGPFYTLLASNDYLADGVDTSQSIGIDIMSQPTYGAADPFERVMQRVSGTFTDVSSEANNAGGTPYAVWQTGAQGATDGLYFQQGSGTFSKILVDIQTAGVGGTPVVEYCSTNTNTATSCDAWTAVSGLSDGTSGFTVDGTISWTDPGAAWISSREPGTAATYNGKWLRIRSSSSPTTAPTANYTATGILRVPTAGALQATGSVSAGGIVDKRIGVNVSNIAPGGVINTQQGIVIDALTGGADNVGIYVGEATGTNNANLVLGQTTTPTGSYSIYNSSTDQNYFAGSLGIGTSSPGSKLDVYNATGTSNVDIFRILSDVGSTANVKFRIDSDGDIFTDGSTTIGTPADIAEKYANEDNAQAGDVVVFTDARTVRKSEGSYEIGLAGVVSTEPGLILSGNTNGVAVALSGRVPVKVSTANGVIKRGDYLTSGPNGRAVKAVAPGPIVGTAMEDANADGTIDVFVHLGYYNPVAGSEMQGNSAGAFGSLNVSGPTTLTELEVTGDAVIRGTLRVGNVIIGGQLTSIGEAPVVTAGAAAGQAGEVTIDGTDVAGTLIIKVRAHTASNSQAAENLAQGEVLSATFTKPYAATPRIVLTPTNDQAVGLPIYVNKTSDGFKVILTQAAQDGAEYHFDYIVIGSQNTTP